MSTATYQVTGMSCGHCEQAIRREIDAVEGLQVVEVSSQTGLLVVFGDAIDPAVVIAAVDEAGYEAAPAS